MSVGGPAAPAARAGLLRQTLALGLALAIVAVAVAGPLRSYIARQSDLAAAQQQIERLQAQKAALEERKRALSDPDYVAAEARRRLQYVSPGQTVYRVIPPKSATPTSSGSTTDAKTATPPAAGPWYAKLWDTVSADVQPGG
ncbi:septum formation initiator family protein [Nakamurella sp. A5-74]|uniref:Septum formation initiator family protein n=1 Tax=Nakamurella sp. A5-74 TaxID=3158264 RepID=A0AAU8DL56_9ACTN